MLILGSLPGRQSLEMRQYYARPHNVFWRIMGALYGAGPELPYDERLKRLIAHRIAIWDVLAQGLRAGSLDAAIVPASMLVNDFPRFLARRPDIGRVVCNGVTAATLYRRRVLPALAPRWRALPVVALPSTSPAYAALDFAAKLALWSQTLAGPANVQIRH